MSKLHHIRLKANYRFLIKGQIYFAIERNILPNHFIIELLNKEIKVLKNDCEILHSKEIE